MSLKNFPTVKQSLFRIGEGCQDSAKVNQGKSGRDLNDGSSSHRHGLVSGGALGAEVLVLKEHICGGGRQRPTAGASGRNREARLAGAVGAVRSDEAAMSISRPRRALLLSFVTFAWLTMFPQVFAQSDADSQWARVEEYEQRMYQRREEKSGDFAEEAEKARREYREIGWMFFKEHPSDERAWNWLWKTLSQRPKYSASGNLDKPARDEWKRRYEEHLKPALFASRTISDKLKRDICAQMLAITFSDEAFQPQKRGEAVNVDSLVSAVMDFSDQFPTDDATVRRYLGTIVYNADRWNITALDRRRYASKFTDSANQALHLMGVAWTGLIATQSNPIDMCLTMLDGQQVTLSEMRGKVVLVDFWNTGCASCIETMPKIKAVYDKYHASGFEVVGICLDEEQNRHSVEALIGKMEIPWSQSLQPGGHENPLAVQYMITSVPVTYLIDQRGMLVTTDVRGPKLEQEVRRLLGRAISQ